VTARKGSKGVPNKNIREFCGLPLFEYSVRSSLCSENIEITIVSSDSEDVRDICEEKYQGVYCDKVFFVQRPEEISGDLSLSEAALIHSYQYAFSTLEVDPEYIVLLQPTSPLRDNKLIDKCFDWMEKNGGDSLFTANKHTPFFWHIDTLGDGSQFVFPNDKTEWDPRPMRQCVKSSSFFWHDNGNVYITKTDVLLRTGNRIGSRPVIYETDDLQSMQIDSEMDFKIMSAYVFDRLGR